MDHPYDTLLLIDPPTSALLFGMKPWARWTEQKPWHDFNHRRGTKDGKQSYCRDCQDDDRLQRFYNFSRQERDLMYARQQGQCPVC
jgi:hypothetical protein